MLLTTILAIYLIALVAIRYLLFPHQDFSYFVEGALLCLVAAVLYQSSYHLYVVTRQHAPITQFVIIASVFYCIYLLLRALLPQSMAALSFSVIVVGATFANSQNISANKGAIIWGELQGLEIVQKFFDMLGSQNSLVMVLAVILYGLSSYFFLKKHRDTLQWKKRLAIFTVSAGLLLML